MPIQLKRYTKSWWESNNPIPKSGEACVEEVSSGVYRIKLGAETIAWNSLRYPFVFTVGDNSLSGIQDFSSGTIKNSILNNYAESIQNISIANSGLIINLSSGNVFRTTLNSNVTGVVFQSPYPSGNCGSITLFLDYIATGYAVTWPSSVYWNGGSGSVPILGSGVGRGAIISFSTTNGGSTYYGFLAGNNFGV